VVAVGGAHRAQRRVVVGAVLVVEERDDDLALVEVLKDRARLVALGQLGLGLGGGGRLGSGGLARRGRARRGGLRGRGGVAGGGGRPPPLGPGRGPAPAG